MSTFVFDTYGTLYDVYSVAEATEDAFPGHGETITQVWRLKQLEYTWLRSLMGRYVDFWEVTRESLVYTLDSLGLDYDPATFDRILDRYLHLSPYPDALAALEALRAQGHTLAILSNGSQEMLDRLVANTGLKQAVDAVISIDPSKTFKPSPSAYALVADTLGGSTDDVVFVSCNPFDVCGAKSFGFNVAWIERVPPQMMQDEVRAAPVVGPGTMFRLLRMQMDTLDFGPDFTIDTLTKLSELTIDR